MAKLTKEQVFYWKLKHDRLWYMENFLKIRDKKSRLVPFKANSAQREFNRIIDEDKKKGKPCRYIILKARQLGMSTFTEGYIYHDTTNNEYRNSLIIAHEEKSTLNLFNMSKLFYEASPIAIRPMKKSANGSQLIFENPTRDDEEKLNNPGLRSRITIATAGTSDTGRSGTYHNVHVSEIAFFPNAMNTMTAILQTVPDEPNTFVCIESTANGVGGYFYDMWYKAVRGENEFTPIFFPWFSDVTYTREFETPEERESFIQDVNMTHIDSSGKTVHTDEWFLIQQFGVTYEQLNWRKWTIANKCNGDLDMFHQEYPATPEEAFISSGRPKFNLKAVKEYEIGCTSPELQGDLYEKNHEVHIDENDKGNLKVWYLPNKDETYVIGADVAEGLATGDYSVAVVLDSKLNVCAKWRGHIDPDLYGKHLVMLAKMYNDAYIAPEGNNHGLTTIRSILNEEYWNIFNTKIYDKVNDEITKKIGWYTTRKTKPLAIDKLSEYIRERYFGMWDFDIIEELYSYVIDDKGGTNAQEGKHDDCVMALAIALQAFLEGRGQNYIPEISREDIVRFEKKKSFDVPEIIDRLFEGDEDNVEYSI